MEMSVGVRMEPIFPRFEDAFLQEFSVCAMFDVDSEPRFQGLDSEIRVQCRYAAEEGWVWIRLRIEIKDKIRGHVHCDIAREGVYVEGDTATTVSSDELENLLRRFCGQRAEVAFNGDYLLSLTDLPRRGIISTLLGVQTEASGAHLFLDGASMAISSDLFTSLNWKYDPVYETVCATLRAETQLSIEPDYLFTLAGQMREGFDCLILEKSGSTTDYDKRTRHVEGGMRKVAKE